MVPGGRSYRHKALLNEVPARGVCSALPAARRLMSDSMQKCRDCGELFSTAPAVNDAHHIVQYDHGIPWLCIVCNAKHCQRAA